MYVNPGTFQRSVDAKIQYLQHALPESPKPRNCLRIRNGGQDRPDSLRKPGEGKTFHGDMREMGKFQDHSSNPDLSPEVPVRADP